MSVIKHEDEKDHTFDDNRRVSFSFSRTKKLDMAETKLEDSDSPDAVDFSVPVKSKKKWKIKLPWKQKKQQTYYDYNDSDEALGKGSDSDSGESSKKRDKKDSDMGKDIVNERSISPSSSSQKVDRPTTWHEGFRSAGSSADSALDFRTKSIEIPKAQIIEKTDVASSLPSHKKDKQYDDVDFIPASSSLNPKQNKSKGKRFRINISAFSKPSHTYENTQLKLSESGERELSPSETSSNSDISKIPLPDNQLSKPNSSLIDIDAHGKSKVETSDKLSSPKLASNVTKVVPPYKKSSSLPSFFKKSKKKKEFDFKTSPPAKGYSSSIQTIASNYPQEQFRSDKTASDSELHHNKTFLPEPSGLHSSIQRKKRRSTRGIYKMSRFSFIADSSGSKSLDNLNRNTASEYVDKKETSLKNVDKDFKSLHDIDVQSKSNSSFQRRPNSGRYTRGKSNFHKSESYDLSSSDESPEPVRFDQKFKSDYALKLQQISTTSESQKKISSSPSNINKEPEHNINKVEKQTVDQNRKLDEFTEFIKSYSSSKSAKISVGSQRKTNKNLNRSAEELEREESEVHSNEKIVAQVSAIDNFTKHQKISISDVKDKSERDKETENYEIPVSDKGTLEHNDKKLKSRAKKLSESSTEKNDITELKHNNSGKHSILKNSLKREAQKSETVESLNNKTNSVSNKSVERQQIKTNGVENVKNTTDFTEEIPHDKECYPVRPREHAGRVHSPHREKSSKKENISSKFTKISTDKHMKSEPIFEKVCKKQSAHINYNEETVPTMRVRRRSYEEMTSLIEEQMFDSESEGEGHDTDGDAVDLSFGRKKIDSNKKDDDFKLCIVTEKGTFSGTELVYEPKILPKKEELLPIPINKTNNNDHLLKRPIEAPPVPPNSSDKADKSDKNASESQNTLMKGENEKIKRKKLRKTQRRRSVSHSSDSDTSIEDANGTLYEKYSSKKSPNEDSHKKNSNQPSMTTEKDHIVSSDPDVDCESPPAFPPPVPPPAEDSPPIHTENSAEISHQPINQLTSTSATSVARNLYIQREERNNLLKNNIPNFTVKNSKLMPETKPPSLTTFSTSYNPKNFTPKYEYAPNLPLVPPSINSKRQPITCYSPPLDDDLGAGTDKLNKGEKYKTFENIDKTTHRSIHNQGPNSNFKYVQNQFSSNVVTENQVYHDKSNVENLMHVQNSAEATLLGELSENPLPDSNNSYMEDYSRLSSVSTINSDNEFVLSKKHFVTFDLPQHEKYIDNTPSYNLQYRDISMYEEKNNQKSVSRHDHSFYRPWPNNVYPYRLNLNTIPKSSSIIREQVRSTQQDMINAPDQREEMHKNLDITSNKNYPHQVYQSSTYPRDPDRAHDRYISVNSPVPYSKQERQLKSILKSHYKREEDTTVEPIQPSLVQTNVKYIQPVMGEVRSDFIRVPNKQSIPSAAKISTAYNTNIERVEIMEDSSNSESEHPPPTPPSYPPPLPRQTWHHQQQKFLGGLLHTESNPNSSFYAQQPPDHSSYYTPTIIEVEAHRGESLERESIYQNVIHASQV